MAEEEKDLKNGGGSPTGDDQPDKKTLKSEGDEDTSKSKDETKEEEDKKPEDEEVNISKSELEQLRKDASEKENYRKAVIRLNREKGRFLPGSEPEKKPKAEEEEEDEEDKKPKGDYVTRQELALRDEKLAISEACKDEEIALNWDEIIVYFIPPKERSYDSLLEAINKAHKVWRVESGLSEKKPEDKGKDSTKELATDKGLSKGKEKQPTPPKKHIIPRREKMENWY